MNKILILPDIHGRTFWKEAINKCNEPDIKIIFLGDYLDPYTDIEGISKKEALSNFKEILELAKNDPRVQLLLGNHDWHYFIPLDQCRMDLLNSQEIKELFVENINLFKLAIVEEIGGTRFLFTHAGVLPGWINSVKDDAKYLLDKKQETLSNEKVDFLNEILSFDHTSGGMEKFLNSFLDLGHDLFKTFPMSKVSRERGGFDGYGSPIWADIYEHLLGKLLDGYYQIFAHDGYYPDGFDSYIISPNQKPFAMIDCRKAFIIDENGKLKEFG